MKFRGVTEFSQCDICQELKAQRLESRNCIEMLLGEVPEQEYQHG